MSQIRYTHETTHVVTGWDRQLQHFHLTVYDITSDLPNQEEEIVLDDCDLPQPLDTAADVIKILSDKHYPVHPELKSTLMDHQIRNAGNEIVILTTPAAGPAGGGGRLNKEKGT